MVLFILAVLNMQIQSDSDGKLTTVAHGLGEMYNSQFEEFLLMHSVSFWGNEIFRSLLCF